MTTFITELNEAISLKLFTFTDDIYSRINKGINESLSNGYMRDYVEHHVYDEYGNNTYKADGIVINYDCGGKDIVRFVKWFGDETCVDIELGTVDIKNKSFKQAKVDDSQVEIQRGVSLF